MVAHQIDDGLHSNADPNDAGGHGFFGEVRARQKSQQCRLAIQRQAVVELGSSDPGQGAFAEQALGDDLCGLEGKT